MRRAFLGLSFSTVLFFFYVTRSSSWNLSLFDHVPHSFSQASIHNSSLSSEFFNSYSPVVPKITIINVFRNPSHPQFHLPNFMASVRANPQVDFLLVKYTQESEEQDGKGCMSVPGLAETPNAREVCLSSDEYWNMHAEWICERWNDCAEEDVELLTAKMKSRAKVDLVVSIYVV